MDRALRVPKPKTSRQAGLSLWLPLHALPGVFQQASAEWIDDNVQRLGASVAFYTLLSLAPLVVIAVAVAALVYGQEAAQGRLASGISGVAGSDLARVVQEIIKGAYQPRAGLIATLLGLGTLVFGASSVFVELHDAMNTIWKVPRPPDESNAATVIRLIRERFYSFVTVLGTGCLLLVSLLWNAWIVAMKISVPRAATFMMSWLMMALLFAALYKIVPRATLRWSDVALGAMITSLLFTVGKQLMGLYFTHTSFASTYGAAGSPLVVLLWVYYSAQLFFWGAEFIKVYTKTVRFQRDRQRDAILPCSGQSTWAPDPQAQTRSKIYN
jgi:membrane protein